MGLHDSYAAQFRDAGSLNPYRSISIGTLVHRWLAATAAPRAGAAAVRLIATGGSFCAGRTATRGGLRRKSVQGRARRTTTDIAVCTTTQSDAVSGFGEST